MLPDYIKLLNYLKLWRSMRGGFWSKVVVVSTSEFGVASESCYWTKGKVSCRYKYYIDKTEYYR